MTDSAPISVQCYSTLSRRVTSALTNHYGQAIAESGLSIQQFSLLRMIERLDTPTLSNISRATGIERSTLGRNLRVLEKDGLIAMKKGQDARTRVALLTEKSRTAMRTAQPHWDRIQKDMERVLPPGARAFFKQAEARLRLV